MKKLLTILILCPILAHAQELTADSVAVAPTLLSQILAGILSFATLPMLALILASQFKEF